MASKYTNANFIGGDNNSASIRIKQQPGGTSTLSLAWDEPPAPIRQRGKLDKRDSSQGLPAGYQREPLNHYNYPEQVANQQYQAQVKQAKIDQDSIDDMIAQQNLQDMQRLNISSQNSKYQQDRQNIVVNQENQQYQKFDPNYSKYESKNITQIGDVQQQAQHTSVKITNKNCTSNLCFGDYNYFKDNDNDAFSKNKIIKNKIPRQAQYGNEYVRQAQRDQMAPVPNINKKNQQTMDFYPQENDQFKIGYKVSQPPGGKSNIQF